MDTRIRIHTKMSWIRNTVFYHTYRGWSCSLQGCGCTSYPGAIWSTSTSGTNLGWMWLNRGRHSDTASYATSFAEGRMKPPWRHCWRPCFCWCQLLSDIADVTCGCHIFACWRHCWPPYFCLLTSLLSAMFLLTSLLSAMFCWRHCWSPPCLLTSLLAAMFLLTSLLAAMFLLMSAVGRHVFLTSLLAAMFLLTSPVSRHA